MGNTHDTVVPVVYTKNSNTGIYNKGYQVPGEAALEDDSLAVAVLYRPAALFYHRAR